jgi:hypothetical protein
VHGGDGPTAYEEEHTASVETPGPGQDAKGGPITAAAGRSGLPAAARGVICLNGVVHLHVSAGLLPGLV